MSFLALVETGSTQAGAAGNAVPHTIIGVWILLLAIFIGFELITKVPPTLHTPLMSGANAISGITIVGAIYCASQGHPTMAKIAGFSAVALATTNVVGGFLVTDRMLSMFGKRGKKSAGASNK